MMEKYRLTPNLVKIQSLQLEESINALGIAAKAKNLWHMVTEINKYGSDQLEFDEFFNMMTTRPS